MSPIELWNYLKANFYIAFIYESRWKIFLVGFGMTILLTIASFVMGTLIGAAFCRLKFVKNKIVYKITNGVVQFFIQIPTLVLLMICVYMIFGKTTMPVVLMIIIGLSVKCGAYICDIFYSAINSLDSGELEAARALGMTQFQVFKYVILPQAVHVAKPVYKNQLIITMQETSVASYMAVLELTRASELITTRTFEAFFSLITAAILYIVLGKILGKIIELITIEKHYKRETV